MDSVPPVSAMCLTYGRPHLLEEAIHSFLLQDYPGPKELIVLNDFYRQKLVFDHREVRVVNVEARFRTLGEKRNACAALACHDILFVWDDDDLYLPWRLSLSIQKLDMLRGFYKSTRAWMLRNGQLEGPEQNLFHSGACFTRQLFDQVRGYPHCGSGQDWGIELDFQNAIRRRKDDHSLTDQELYYIYRWEGTGSYHLSAFGRDEGQSITGNAKVAGFVDEQVRSGAVPVGDVHLQPTWRRDYLQLVRQRLDLQAHLPNRPAQVSIPNLITAFQSEHNREKSMSLPMVSCIMPTYGRPDYVAESIAMFLAQDYPAKELIILNDCPGQILEGEFPDVRIVNAPERWKSLGHKRNAAIELAQGDFIAVWDDDDVYLPWRLSYSMQRMQELQLPLYCPAEYWAYWGADDLHHNQSYLDWIYHPLVIFQRELWKTVGGYPAKTMGEDTVFFRKVLKHLGIEWPRDPIPESQRVMILRGKSKYVHTSIDGGAAPPDTEPRTISLQPCAIQDPVLHAAAKRLIQTRYQEIRRYEIALATARSWPGVPANAPAIFLDELTPVTAIVGYGAYGQRGALGYGEMPVRVCGQSWPRALSAHGPSKLSFQLNGQYSHLCCHVAMNDDVPPDASAADFLVRADGRLVVIAKNVRSQQVPRVLIADVRGAKEIELIVYHHRWENCHSVWLDPVLFQDVPRQELALRSALDRADITLPVQTLTAELCIATVGSPGFEDWVDDLLSSICANAQCAHALLAIFFYGESQRIREVAEKYGAVIIPCQPLRPLNMTCKAVLYTAGRVIDAEKFICIDADVLVLDDLRPIVAALDALPEGSILICREAGFHGDLGAAVETMYFGDRHDVTKLLVADPTDSLAFPLVVNDGIFAGTRAALCGLDDFLRGVDAPAGWVDDPGKNILWRNQFVLNLALAQTRSGVKLDSRYNVQLHTEAIHFSESSGFIEAESDYRRAAVVHFDGRGKYREVAWQGRFRAISKPLSPRSESDYFHQFLSALRRWIGRYGLDAMAWSFYGTPDARHARVNDPATFSLYATLHHLVRTNGCHRVVETGTARGVSAACLASAIAHHDDAQVVTLDRCIFPERATLWAALPAAVRRAIEPRQVDVFDGLQTAINQGESFHAALLDSQHTAEHVLKEFTLATQLVCPGGLILIHDAILHTGTVGQALDEIARQGYGVVRLWTAEGGDPADAGLGLAVIENRRRTVTPD